MAADHLPDRCDVLVIGAGPAGPAAACHLTDRGRDAHVVDATDAVGGRIRSDVVDSFLRERGYQVLNTAYPELLRLFTCPAWISAISPPRPTSTWADAMVSGRRAADAVQVPAAAI